MRQIFVSLIVLAAACGDVKEFPDGAVDAPGTEIDAAVETDANDFDAPPAMRTVTVALAGNGTGTVTSNVGGINCPGTCNALVPEGTLITLTAAPQGASMFLGWSGGSCTGTGTCSFTVTTDTQINASFALDFTLVVTLTGTGTGGVTSVPAGINCPGDCDQTYGSGTVVTLTATPSADSTFVGWSGGGCGGTGDCVVTVSAAVAVTASFALRQYTLTVGTNGTGSGSVMSNVGGINCPGTCSATFNHGQMVTLTPTPGASSTFAGWTGACTGTGGCTVTMTQARTVTATFNAVTYTLTVNRSGDGSGSVTSNVGGINCPGTCSVTLNGGTAITLTATAATSPLSALSDFGGWTGGGCSGTGGCSFTLSANTTIGAAFTLRPNVVFMTSTSHTGNMGGLSGADSICQARAAAVNLSGTYRAWLATPAATAPSRLGSASGWVLTDGRPFAYTVNDLSNGRIYYPLRRDERNSDVGDVNAHTGAFVNGQIHPSFTSCADYTSTTAGTVSDGVSEGVGYLFTAWGSSSCASSARILCFGIDRQATVLPVPPANFRRAFTTAASWTPGGGLGSADALCQSEANAAGLPGTYLAMLATTSASAASRFNTGGAPWGRPDGILITASASTMFSTTRWETAPNANAALTTYPANNGVWSGASTATAIGTTATTCSNWNSNTGTGMGGRSGFIALSSALAYDSGNACNSTNIKLRCLQQ